MSIRLRLTLWYAATLVGLFLVGGTIIWVQYGRMLQSTTQDTLRARAEDVRLSLAVNGNGRPETTDPAWLGIFAAVFTRTGALASASRDTPAGIVPPPVGSYTMRLGPQGLSYAVEVTPGPQGMTIVAGRPMAQIDASLKDLAALMAGVGLLAGGASVVGGWRLAGRALRPVGLMVREANSIGMEDLERRLPVSPADDEVSRLARTMNSLLDRVAEGVRREHRFVMTASHELRTPIAALQTELELASTHERDPAALLAAIHAAHADTVRLAALASDLLRLAEADSAGRELLRQSVSLRELADGMVARFGPLATPRGVRVVVDAPDASVFVDRLRIEQALGNLLSNAILESGDEGEVEVRARVLAGAGKEARRLEVDVLDRGPGVPAALRDRLFMPFGSGPSGREGRTGLGLATAAAAVRAHEGRIWYRDRPGGGAWFGFVVPASTPGDRSRAEPASAGAIERP